MKVSSRLERRFAWALADLLEGSQPLMLGADLPGYPDLFLPNVKLVIQIDGCFSHYCQDCYPTRIKPFHLKGREVRIANCLNRRGIRLLRLQEHALDTPYKFNDEVYKAATLASRLNAWKHKLPPAPLRLVPKSV